MNERENLLSLLRRQGYQFAPTVLTMCPSIQQQMDEWERANPRQVRRGFEHHPWGWVRTPSASRTDVERFEPYYSPQLLRDPAFSINNWGMGRRKTPSSMHMAQYFYPLAQADSVEQIEAFPLANYPLKDNIEFAVRAVSDTHGRGLASLGDLGTTVWEPSWQLRSMESLMMDMACDDPMATALLDRVTDIACERAEIYAKAGVDMILLGDDIGMQQTIMMSETMYCEWLKPRLERIIRAARAHKPDIIMIYHSCGYVEPFIPHLIEVGVDVLNPVQPECMDFGALHEQYGEKLSFYGTIGTQTTMPFGTPDEVRRVVERNLDIAGDKGGLIAAPTHMLEPEVPLANILAYLDACEGYK